MTHIAMENHQWAMASMAMLVITRWYFFQTLGGHVWGWCRGSVWPGPGFHDQTERTENAVFVDLLGLPQASIGW